MFRTIFAEIKYFKGLFIIIYGSILFLFIKTVIGELNAYDFMISSSILFFIAMGIWGIACGVEKRERYVALLPLSIKKIGIQGLLFIILIKASIFLLWVIAYFTKHIQQDSGFIWTMISLAMLNLIVVGVIAIGIELGYYGTRFRIPIFVIFMIGAIFLFSFSLDVMSPAMNTGVTFLESPEFLKTPIWALLVSLLAGFILYLDYILFMNRKYFLN